MSSHCYWTGHPLLSEAELSNPYLYELTKACYASVYMRRRHTVVSLCVGHSVCL